MRKCDATGQSPSCVDCRTFVALRTSVAADGHAEATHPLDVFAAELSPVGQRFGDIESRIGGVTHQGGRGVELDRVLLRQVVRAPRETENRSIAVINYGYAVM